MLAIHLRPNIQKQFNPNVVVQCVWFWRNSGLYLCQEIAYIHFSIVLIFLNPPTIFGTVIQNTSQWLLAASF
jgi:hypothetical protein